MPTELWLIRHGQTEWSQTGQHTGRTDIPLTPHGESLATSLQPHLSAQPFSLVLSSPLLRARDTARLAGFPSPTLDPDLAEWDYGQFEGKTSADIHRTHPAWSIWTGPWPGGETLEAVAERARRVIDRSLQVEGRVAVFAHGHILRVLAAVWLEQDAACGRLFALDVASVSRLGWEHGVDRVIHTWNQTFEECTDNSHVSSSL